MTMTIAEAAASGTRIRQGKRTRTRTAFHNPVAACSILISSLVYFSTLFQFHFIKKNMRRGKFISSYVGQGKARQLRRAKKNSWLFVWTDRRIYTRWKTDLSAQCSLILNSKSKVQQEIFHRKKAIKAEEGKQAIIRKGKSFISSSFCISPFKIIDFLTFLS